MSTDFFECLPLEKLELSSLDSRENKLLRGTVPLERQNFEKYVDVFETFEDNCVGEKLKSYCVRGQDVRDNVGSVAVKGGILFDVMSNNSW